MEFHVLYIKISFVKIIKLFVTLASTTCVMSPSDDYCRKDANFLGSKVKDTAPEALHAERDRQKAPFLSELFSLRMNRLYPERPEM